MLFTASAALALDLPLVGNTAKTAKVELSTADTTLNEQLNRQLEEYARSHSNGNDRRRQQTETMLLRKLLRSEGYYNSLIHNPKPYLYQVEQGPRYAVGQWHIRPTSPVPLTWPKLPIQEGEPLRATNVLTARLLLQQFLLRNCYAEAKVSHEVILNPGRHEAEVIFRIEPGPALAIGDIRFTGLEKIHADYLHHQTKLQKGQCLRTKTLDDARLLLLQTGLLSNAHYVLSDIAATESGSHLRDIEFRVRERQSRSLKASVGYTSDASEGVRVGWENRNLFGGAERLTLEAGADQLLQYASARLELPQFGHPQQTLQFNALMEQEHAETYDSNVREISTILTRQWRETLSTSAGIAYTQSEVEEKGQTDTFDLISLPMGIILDHRNDKLDPTKGWLASLSVRPFKDLYQDNLHFVQSTAKVMSYLSISDWPWQPTLALRGAAGVIQGASLEHIPADQRFYVGGGGSVRGYGYQTVGDIEEGEPTGGRAFMETSVEVRLRLTPSWGLVAFTDGGYAYQDNLLSNNEMLWGAGLGVRYFTRFAPLRFDIGVPLNQRDSIDSGYQIYISFGQAF